jgi:hypothetical protein
MHSQLDPHASEKHHHIGTPPHTYCNHSPYLEKLKKKPRFEYCYFSNIYGIVFIVVDHFKKLACEFNS